MLQVLVCVAALTAAVPALAAPPPPPPPPALPGLPGLPEPAPGVPTVSTDAAPAAAVPAAPVVASPPAAAPVAAAPAEPAPPVAAAPAPAPAAPVAAPAPESNLVTADVIPPYAVVFPLPTTGKWIRAYQTGDGKNSGLLEFVPEGQTVDNWKEMVTLHFAAIDKPVTGKQLVDMLKAGGEKACPGLIAQVTREQKHDPFEMITLMTECPKAIYSGQPERTTYRYYITAGMLLNLQRAVRGPAVTPLKDITQDWLYWVEVLTVCDTRKEKVEACAARVPKK